jgi:hypothetical protein
VDLAATAMHDHPHHVGVQKSGCVLRETERERERERERGPPAPRGRAEEWVRSERDRERERERERGPALQQLVAPQSTRLDIVPRHAQQDVLATPTRSSILGSEAYFVMLSTGASRSAQHKHLWRVRTAPDSLIRARVHPSATGLSMRSLTPPPLSYSGAGCCSTWRAPRRTRTRWARRAASSWRLPCCSATAARAPPCSARWGCSRAWCAHPHTHTRERAHVLQRHSGESSAVQCALGLLTCLVRDDLGLGGREGPVFWVWKAATSKAEPRR